MRTNLEDFRSYRQRNFAPKYPCVRQTVSGTFVLPTEGPMLQGLDPQGGSVTVRLPTLVQELAFFIANVGTSGTLNIVDSLGAAVLSLVAQEATFILATTREWVYLRTGSVGSTRVVTSTGAILTSDIVVQTNQAAAITLTLPTAAAWSAVNGNRGIPLQIFDRSGTAGTNLVTIQAASGENISGLESREIAGDYQGYRLQPASGGWLVV